MLKELVEIIFPKFCLGCGAFGKYLCEKCRNLVERRESTFCSECGRASISGVTHARCFKTASPDGLVCLFEYKDPLRTLLHQLKYKFSREVAVDLETLLEKVSLKPTFRDFTLVPVPLNAQRENWRGFNQTELLGEQITRHFDLEFETKALARSSFTRPQVELKLAERENNLRGNFMVVDKDKVAGRKILVFDDVWTTGATLREAAVTLKRAGAQKVWALAFATSHRIH